MAAKKPGTGMKHKADRKTRGRTTITGISPSGPTSPDTPISRRTGANRPVTANGDMNKHRGDRRDTNKTYTNNAKHAARGNTPRRDVSTRKR